MLSEKKLHFWPLTQIEEWRDIQTKRCLMGGKRRAVVCSKILCCLVTPSSFYHSCQEKASQFSQRIKWKNTVCGHHCHSECAEYNPKISLRHFSVVVPRIQGKQTSWKPWRAASEQGLLQTSSGCRAVTCQC